MIASILLTANLAQSGAQHFRYSHAEAIEELRRAGYTVKDHRAESHHAPAWRITKGKWSADLRLGKAQTSGSGNEMRYHDTCVSVKSTLLVPKSLDRFKVAEWFRNGEEELYRGNVTSRIDSTVAVESNSWPVEKDPKVFLDGIAKFETRIAEGVAKFEGEVIAPTGRAGHLFSLADPLPVISFMDLRILGDIWWKEKTKETINYRISKGPFGVGSLGMVFAFPYAVDGVLVQFTLSFRDADENFTISADMPIPKCTYAVDLAKQLNPPGFKIGGAKEHINPLRVKGAFEYYYGDIDRVVLVLRWNLVHSTVGDFKKVVEEFAAKVRRMIESGKFEKIEK